MKYFSHKCIIKCVRNKTQESIILIHLNTFFATLKSTWRKLRSYFTCKDPFGSHLPTKQKFWSQKVSTSIHHQVHANVSERHVPLRLLHPCSSESERNTNTCNCCNANAWKRNIPSRLLHLCSSESECNTNTCNCCNANAWKRHIPSRILHVCSSESECKHPHLLKVATYNWW